MQIEIHRYICVYVMEEDALTKARMANTKNFVLIIIFWIQFTIDMCRLFGICEKQCVYPGEIERIASENIVLTKRWYVKRGFFLLYYQMNVSLNMYNFNVQFLFSLPIYDITIAMLSPWTKHQVKNHFVFLDMNSMFVLLLMD